MARRTRKVKEDSERWLVSYADLLTLLFAFFVVMFASSHRDKSRAEQISRAVNTALQSSSLPGMASLLSGSAAAKAGGLTGVPGSGFDRGGVSTSALDFSVLTKALRTSLSSEMNHGEVEVHLERRGIVISLNTQSLFASGGDVIAEGMLPVLSKVADLLKKVPNPIRLEGHTDSIPIQNQRFRSNWELSAARSIAMLRVLNEVYGVSRDRMAIVGFADTGAVGDNGNAIGRMKNRRVDVVLLSDFGQIAEPGRQP